MRIHIILASIALASTSAAQTKSARPGAVPPAARQIDIVGLDYSFQTPPRILAGRTTFHFINTGTVRHELNISLLKRGATVEQFLDAVRSEKPTNEFREGPVGVLFSEPRSRSSAGLTSDLLAGRTYVVICIVRDSAKAKRHVDMGMYTTIVPAEAAAESSPPIRADTIVATDYAFRYPRTLAPGRHSFAFVNEGKFRHEVSIVLLKKGVTIQRALDVQKAGGDVDALIDDAPGLLHSPARTSPLGLLEIDLLPGRDYALVCLLKNDAKSPPHIALGMYGSIHVTGTAR